MIKANDKITYKVIYRHNGKMFVVKTENFNYALKTFYNLNVVAFLDFTAAGEGSSISASLLKRTIDGDIQVIHQHYLDILSKGVL